jgi:hypothetical protein
MENDTDKKVLLVEAYGVPMQEIPSSQQIARSLLLICELPLGLLVSISILESRNGRKGYENQLQHQPQHTRSTNASSQSEE